MQAIGSRRGAAAVLMLLPAWVATGCTNLYMDQTAVPDTNQRLVVGYDNVPNKKVWVIDGDEVEEVKIVRKEGR